MPWIFARLKILLADTVWANSCQAASRLVRNNCCLVTNLIMTLWYGRTLPCNLLLFLLEEDVKQINHYAAQVLKFFFFLLKEGNPIFQDFVHVVSTQLKKYLTMLLTPGSCRIPKFLAFLHLHLHLLWEGLRAGESHLPVPWTIHSFPEEWRDLGKVTQETLLRELSSLLNGLGMKSPGWRGRGSPITQL